jgi:hypothetical protein
MLSFKSKLFILLFSGISIFQLSAQDLYKVEMSIKREQPAELASYFKSKVKLSLNNKVEFVSDKEAQLRMQKFFEEEEVRSYVRKHTGGKGDSKYVVGELITTDQTYRVMIYYSDADSTIKVSELRINP